MSPPVSIENRILINLPFRDEPGYTLSHISEKLNVPEPIVGYILEDLYRRGMVVLMYDGWHNMHDTLTDDNPITQKVKVHIRNLGTVSSNNPLDPNNWTDHEILELDLSHPEHYSLYDTIRTCAIANGCLVTIVPIHQSKIIEDKKIAEPVQHTNGHSNNHVRHRRTSSIPATTTTTVVPQVIDLGLDMSIFG